MVRAGRVTISGLVAAVLIMAGACSAEAPTESAGAGAATDSGTSTNGTLLVGSVASLTGNAAPYGLSQSQGTELAIEVEQAGGDAPISLTSLNDRSSPEGGITAFNTVIEQGAAAILGPTLSPVAAQTDPLAQAVGVPVLAVTNTTLDIAAIGDAVWRVTLSERVMIPQAVEAAKDLRGVRTAVLISDGTDDYSTGAAAAFRDGAQSAGVELSEDIVFDPTTLDEAGYEELITRALQGTPDGLFLAARSTPATNLLLAADATDANVPLVGGNGFNAPEVLVPAGPAAAGLIVAASWNPDIDVEASRTFVRRFEERYGRSPDAFAAQGYAGIQILVAAVRSGGGTSRQAITEGLRRLGEVETVLGTLSFADNEAVYPASIQEYVADRFELLQRGSS